MTVAVAYDHADQKRRRQRARISQQAIASRLSISDSAVSDYERRGRALPFALTSEDYERALLDAIEAKRKAEGK